MPKDYPDEVAADFPDCLAIVEEKVKPERMQNNRKVYRDYWWHYAEKRPALCATIEGMPRVLVRAQVSRTHAPVFAETNRVFSMMCIVFPLIEYSDYSTLQSNLHEAWINNYSSSLKGDQRYTPSDCCETFPFPEATASLESIGEQYHAHRQAIMLARQEGLTKTYNRFHNPAESAADIQRLRALHQQMDEAVAAAYGWTDLALGHDFHATKQGTRFTLSEPARREVLDRLLELNHRRYAEEQAAGLHDKGKKKVASGQRSVVRKKQAASSGLQPEQETLFELDDQQKLFK